MFPWLSISLLNFLNRSTSDNWNWSTPRFLFSIGAKLWVVPVSEKDRRSFLCGRDGVKRRLFVWFFLIPFHLLRCSFYYSANFLSSNSDSRAEILWASYSFYILARFLVYKLFWAIWFLRNTTNFQLWSACHFSGHIFLFQLVFKQTQVKVFEV